MYTISSAIDSVLPQTGRNSDTWTWGAGLLCFFHVQRPCILGKTGPGPSAVPVRQHRRSRSCAFVMTARDEVQKRSVALLVLFAGMRFHTIGTISAYLIGISVVPDVR